MTNIRVVLAQNMKARRKDLGISQADLAERINTSPNYISKIESEKQFPSVQMIEKIAESLGIDSVDLFSTKREEKKNLDIVQNDLVENVTNQIKKSFNELNNFRKN